MSLGICAHADKMRVLSVLTINLQSHSAEEATNIGDGYNEGVFFQFFRVSYALFIFWNIASVPPLSGWYCKASL